MADVTETILIDIQIPKGDNEKRVDDLTKSIIGLQKANKDLQAENKELAKSGQENSKEYIENTKQIEANKIKLGEANATRKGLIQTLGVEANSIKALQERNKELIKQRNSINTSTDEGKKKIQEINAELDRNNNIIKENNDALGQQKINIGNYASALDGVVPGLSGMVTGIQASARAALAFIATGIGAVIAALGLALAAVTNYLKNTEEGQDKLNKVTQIAAALWGKFGDAVRDVGELIVNAIENPQQAIKDFGKLIQENLINRFNGLLNLIPNLAKATELLFSGKFAEAGKLAADSIGQVVLGVENLTDKVQDFAQSVIETVNLAVAEGAKVAQLQKEIRNLERAYLIDSANTNLQVAKLRSEALKVEGEERKKIIEEAIALEQRLGDSAVKLAEKKFELAKLEGAIADNDIAANDALVKAEAELIQARQQRFDSTLRFEKQLEAVNEQIKNDNLRRIKEIEDANKEQFANNIKFLEQKASEELLQLKDEYLNKGLAKEEFERRLTEIEITALEERLAFLAANGESTLAIEQAIIDRRIAAKQKEVDTQKKILAESQKAEQQQLNFAVSTSDQLAGLLKENTGTQKAAAIASTSISTYASAQKAYESQFLPPTPDSPVRGAVAAAFAIVSGLARVAAIAGFADGGLTGTRIRSGHGIPISRSNGDNMLATVKTGEVILNQQQQAALGGSATFARIGVPGFATGGITGDQTRIATQRAQQTFDMNQLGNMINMVQPVLVLEEFETKQFDVGTIRNRAQVI
jgi:hypothetical protein